MIAPPAVLVPDVAAVQRRTLRVLFGTQVIGGVGVTIGVTVGALLAVDLGGTGISGLASSCAVVGAALLAVPVTRLMQRRGRRPGLLLAYGAGALGALLVVAAAVLRSAPLLFVGMLLFGGGSAANLQARYTAADLAPADRRARQLSMVVWATTLGAVTAPNLAAFADDAVGGLDLPEYSGPFLVSTVVFGLAALLLGGLLRPDPLLLARRLAAAGDPATPDGPTGVQIVDPPGPATDAQLSEQRLSDVQLSDPQLSDVQVSDAQLSGVQLADPVRPVAPPDGERAAGSEGLRSAFRTVMAIPAARLGLAGVAVGHVVMITVMSMTPVYIGATHTDHAVVLRIVGFVLSAHIAGMFALSPVVGWLADRLGRPPVILLGIGVLLVACAVAGTAQHRTPQLTIGLALLGLGWSCTMVAGSTLLSESVPVGRRPVVQGLSDLTMGLAGASAGALSGVIVDLVGYPALSLLAAMATVPVVALALRPVTVKGNG